MLSVGQRIVIVGTTGAGKTTLARQLSARLAIPHVELDALNWEANWTESAPDVLRERVSDALSGGAWIVDGNYGKVRDLSWPRADTIIWLDYPLALILWRLSWRTFRRVTKRETLWAGNRETLPRVFSADSIILWALRTHRRRQREIPELLARPEHVHLRVIRLRSARAMREWLNALIVTK